jgi:hypothetical protein
MGGRGILLLMIMLLVLATPRNAVAAKQDEYQIKAVFVLNFAKLTEWPTPMPDGGEPFTIAILGKIPSATFMTTLRGALIRGAKTSVRHVESAAETRGTQLVYISASEGHRAATLLKELRHQGALTVSDMEGFCEAGGMIQLVRIQNRIGFEVNLTAVRRARLTLSSQLLKLARMIHDN